MWPCPKQIGASEPVPIGTSALATAVEVRGQSCHQSPMPPPTGATTTPRFNRRDTDGPQHNTTDGHL
jgi:hypothetical protein